MLLLLLLLLLLVVTCSILGAEAVFEAALILPHGDAALDPTIHKEGTPAREAADEIANAAHTAGHWLSKRINKPNVLFLSTPHGLQLDNDFGLYLNAYASGYADIGSDLLKNHTNETYRVTLPTMNLAPVLAQDMMRYLNKNGTQNNVTGISLPGGDFPLRWAEVIPLLLLRPLSLSSTVRTVIWSHPKRRYQFSREMIPELLELGRRLRTYFDALPERVAVIISGDLSHTHLPNGPYGYSNASQPMDAALGQWAASPCQNADALLKTAANLQQAALSCGWTGFVLLHGMLLCGQTEQWEASTVFVNRNATYFGMMVATFAPQTGMRVVPG